MNSNTPNSSPINIEELIRAALEIGNLLEFGRAYAKGDEGGDSTWLTLLSCIDSKLGDILSMVDEAREQGEQPCE